MKPHRKGQEPYTTVHLVSIVVLIAAYFMLAATFVTADVKISTQATEAAFSSDIELLNTSGQGFRVFRNEVGTQTAPRLRREGVVINFKGIMSVQADDYIVYSAPTFIENVKNPPFPATNEGREALKQFEDFVISREIPLLVVWVVSRTPGASPETYTVNVREIDEGYTVIYTDVNGREFSKGKMENDQETGTSERAKDALKDSKNIGNFNDEPRGEQTLEDPPFSSLFLHKLGLRPIKEPEQSTDLSPYVLPEKSDAFFEPKSSKSGGEAVIRIPGWRNDTGVTLSDFQVNQMISIIKKVF